MKKLLLMMMAGLLVTACASKPKTEQAAEEPAKKVLVLYYSVTNTTKQMAEYIQQKTGADIEAITPVNAYSSDYGELIKRSQEEIQGNILPELKPFAHNVADYDIIFLGRSAFA